MNLKLFSNTLVPQLNRLFTNAAADDRSCYLVRLNQGFTETDLNRCLTLQAATGAGYMFDANLAASTGVCTVLARGTNCNRIVTREALRVFDCSLTAVAEGIPTHLILGGILPFCLQVGADVTLLYPDMNIKYDLNGYKTQVSIQAFTIPLANIWSDAVQPFPSGNEFFAFDQARFAAPSFTDYSGKQVTLTGIARPAADTMGIDLGTTGQLNVTSAAFNPAQSFTIECMYHQSGVSGLAEMKLLAIGTDLSNRFMLTFDRSNQTGLCIWNNVGGGDPSPKVQRALSLFTQMQTLAPTKLKYVYDSTKSLHSVYFGGVLLDSFTYTVLNPNKPNIAISGGYGSGANANFTPIFDQFSIRQGVY